jgi:pimeloyl-ACP methyl ester carboxylesterase
MDKVGLWQAVLIGHSLGGAVALSVAANHPERICGLGLVSSGHRLQVPGVLLENVSNPSTFSFAAQALHSLMCGSQIPSRLAEENLERLLSLRPTLLYGDLLTCLKYDATDWLDSIKIPVLVTCGTEDKLTPPRYSSFLAASIPGAALQTVDGAGHMVMLEQPHRMQKLISVFLKSIPYVPGV